MGVIYSDIYSPATDVAKAANAFRDLLRSINRRIADTTNSLRPGKNSYLYRIIQREIAGGTPCSDISLVTFNYDLYVEKTLAALARSDGMTNHRPIIDFPDCYHLTDYQSSTAPSSAPTFAAISGTGGGIDVLKLHGSLNWFSRHLSRDPTPRGLLNPLRDLWVTPRTILPLNMTQRVGRRRRRMYTYPVIVPPVTHKSSILHQSLTSVWERADAVLEDATKVIIYGYSSPVNDTESANLLARNLRRSPNLESATVINPSLDAFQRFVEITELDAVHYYRHARAYLAST